MLPLLLLTHVGFGQNSEKKIKKGDKYYSFTLEDRTGKKTAVAVEEGRYLLLDFAATGCKPCLKVIPELRKLQNKYRDRLSLVSVWHDRSKNVWLNKAVDQKKNVIWIDLWDENLEVFRAYSVTVFPTYILVDPDGIVVGRWTAGYKEGRITKKVEKHLNL